MVADKDETNDRKIASATNAFNWSGAQLRPRRPGSKLKASGVFVRFL